MIFVQTFTVSSKAVVSALTKEFPSSTMLVKKNRIVRFLKDRILKQHSRETYEKKLIISPGSR